MSTVTISRPVASSLAALNARRGGIAGDLAARASELDADLRALHENFRHAGPPEEFVKRAGKLIRLRDRAEAMRAAVDQDFTPPPRPTVAGEVLQLLGAARMRVDEAIAWIRMTRPAMIARLKADLAELEARAKELADGYGVREFTIANAHLGTGESTQLDEHLRLLVSVFERRAVLNARLELLIAGEDYQDAVAKAIDAAGGAGAVAGLAARQLAAEDTDPAVLAAEGRVQAVAERLASIDPDSELATRLASEKAAHDDAAAAARARRRSRAEASAADLVADVLAGDGGRAVELERIASPNLTFALLSARAGDEQFEATIAAVLDESIERETEIVERARAASITFAGR